MAPKRFKMVGYAGSAIQLPWWGRVLFDVAGMSMKARLPVLREHQRDRAVGVLDKLTKEPARLVGEGFFVESPDGQEVQALLKQGFPFQASVGISVDEVEEVKEGESVSVNGGTFQGPGFVFRVSEVHEISACTLGADRETSVNYLAASMGANMPKNFDEAICLKLREGLPVNAAIQAAARDYPALYETYNKQVLGQTDPGSADVALARKAELLAIKEGIDLESAMLKVFQDPQNKELVTRWEKEF